LEWANFSIGRTSAYQLNISVRNLCNTLSSDFKQFRFVGIIKTKALPYYVFEVISLPDEEPVDETTREGTAGVNKYTYYVSNSVTATPSEWNVLPPVTMDQIVTSRQFRLFLTGDLEASVPSYPPFPGVEKNLLRALIAEIVGSTSISPIGLYDLDEEGDVPQVKPTDPIVLADRPLKTAVELKSPENWKHHEMEINELGRITALPVNEDENEENPIPEVELPKPLDDLKPSKWSFRTFLVNDKLVVARNMEWPGAVTVTSGTT
jgi:radial spoke head protein 4A